MPRRHSPGNLLDEKYKRGREVGQFAPGYADRDGKKGPPRVGSDLFMRKSCCYEIRARNPAPFDLAS